MGGDVYLAEDAAQDAFLEALGSLDRLRDPDAFAGWLRAIVRKRADRILRRRREQPISPEMLGVHPAASLAGVDGSGGSDGSDGDPHLAALAWQRARAVQAALRTAAEADRTVLGLHYLAGWSYADIAHALDLPLSTVRKRLHDARRRIEPRLAAELASARERTAPLKRSRENQIMFLHAARTGDLARTGALLAAHRSLADLREPVGHVHVRGRRLPMRPGYRPLHRAAASGDVALVRTLLDYGADPRVRDDHGETPLHTAAVYGEQAVAALLLACGADIDVVTATGMTPADWAALRGRREVGGLLVQRGARPSTLDRCDRTPAAGLPASAQPEDVPMTDDSMLGRVLAPGGSALDDGPRMVWPDHQDRDRTRGSQLLPTGIRAVDIPAPLVRGGTVELRGPEGAGQLVLVAEILRNLVEERGAVSVQCGIARHAFGAADDLRDGLEPMGVAEHATLILASADAADTERADAVRSATAVAADLAASGRDVLLVFDRDVLPDAAQAVDAAGVIEGGAVTVAVISVDREGQPAPQPLGADTALVFDAALARAGVYPAVAPRLSSSRLVAEAELAEDHLRAARRVVEADQASARLYAFLRQPFTVAHPWTGQPGEASTVHESLERAGDVG